MRPACHRIRFDSGALRPARVEREVARGFRGYRPLARRALSRYNDVGINRATVRRHLLRPAPAGRRVPAGQPSYNPDRSGGCSSVGRASACHAEGRGFEPLHPLHRKPRSGGVFAARWKRSRAGRTDSQPLVSLARPGAGSRTLARRGCRAERRPVIRPRRPRWSGSARRRGIRGASPPRMCSRASCFWV